MAVSSQRSLRHERKFRSEKGENSFTFNRQISPIFFVIKIHKPKPVESDDDVSMSAK